MTNIFGVSGTEDGFDIEAIIRATNEKARAIITAPLYMKNTYRVLRFFFPPRYRSSGDLELLQVHRPLRLPGARPAQPFTRFIYLPVEDDGAGAMVRYGPVWPTCLARC